MSRVALKLAMVMVLAGISNSSTFAVTFAEALKDCKNINTDRCQQIRKLYLKKKAEFKKQQQQPSSEQTDLSTRPIYTPSVTAPIVAEEPAVAATPEAVKSPFGMLYFMEMANIGPKTDTGESAARLYGHLHTTYKTKWWWSAFARVIMSGQVDTTNDKELLTFGDPRLGIEGGLWSSGKLSFWSRAFVGLPLSQGSVDNGLTMGFGTDHSFGVAFTPTFSFAFDFGIRGSFFGFGSEDERANGSMYIEPNITFTLSEKANLTFVYSSGFSRKVGQDLGILVFNGGDQTLVTKLQYNFSPLISVTPGVDYNLVSNDISFRFAIGGRFF